MALATKNPNGDNPKSPLLPQAGEERLTGKVLGEAVDALPEAVAKHIRAHVLNGETFIVPGKGGAFPKGVVAVVRDRKGLLGWDADGAGKRLDAPNLAAVGGKPAKAEKPKKEKAAPPAPAPEPEVDTPADPS